MNISVVGLGHHAWGVDINPWKVDLISRDLSLVVEPGPAGKLARAVQGARRQATTSAKEVLIKSDVSFGGSHTNRHNGEIGPGRPFCHRVAETPDGGVIEMWGNFLIHYNKFAVTKGLV